VWGSAIPPSNVSVCAWRAAATVRLGQDRLRKVLASGTVRIEEVPRIPQGGPANHPVHAGEGWGKCLEGGAGVADRRLYAIPLTAVRGWESPVRQRATWRNVPGKHPCMGLSMKPARPAPAWLPEWPLSEVNNRSVFAFSPQTVLEDPSSRDKEPVEEYEHAPSPAGDAFRQH